MQVRPDLNIIFCTYLLTNNILWVALSTYNIILRVNLLKIHRINGLYNRSTNTLKRPASQTNGNFLFLVRRLNILWAINQGPSRGFATLVFLHVLNDNDVFQQLPTNMDFLSVWKTSVPFASYIPIGIVTLQCCITIH